MPLTMVAVSGVEPEEAGSASGLLNVTQQVGGSLGLAILTTAFATAQRHAAAHGATGDAKLAHGISTALQVSVVFGVAAMLASIFLITAKASDLDRHPCRVWASCGPASCGPASCDPASCDRGSRRRDITGR